MAWATTNSSQGARTFARRSFLETGIGACAITPSIRLALQLGTPGSGSLTKEERDRMSPGVNIRTEASNSEIAAPDNVWVPASK
jgi:hypothetical protein